MNEVMKASAKIRESLEALAKVIFVILSKAKDLDSSVACGSLRMTDMGYLQEAPSFYFLAGGGLALQPY